jgi:hypothetical protein
LSDDDEMLYMFYVNEEKLNKCPRINLSINNQNIPAVVDTESQISLITEEMYRKLKSEGVKSLELGVQNAVLVKCIWKQDKAYSHAGYVATLYRQHYARSHFFNITPTINPGTTWRRFLPTE